MSIESVMHSIVCIDHIVFIYSSINEHSACFHFFTILSDAAKNMGVQILFEILFSVLLSIYPEVKLLYHWLFYV